MAPQRYPASPLLRREGRPKGHAFVAPGDYVLEGRLFVACDGETVEAVTGDVVRVPAGSVGRYWAPEYARMVAVYGPNPHGLESRVHAFTRWEPSAGETGAAEESGGGSAS